MSDLAALWKTFKDSTVLQAVLGALVGFIVMHVFQRRASSASSMEQELPGLHGQQVPTPDDFLLGDVKRKRQQQQQQQQNKKGNSKPKKPAKKMSDILDLESSSDYEDHNAAAADDDEAMRRRRGKKIDEVSNSEEEEEEEGQSAVGSDEEEEEEKEQVAYSNVEFSEEEMLQRSEQLLQLMQRRRSCRRFSDRPINRKILQNIIAAASTAPSGAHTQPWTYILISEPAIKRRIRQIVEEEEEINYARRMGPEWRADLKKLGTNWEKPYLTDAPYIIVLMRQLHGIKAGSREGHGDKNKKQRHYYSEISVSISAGLLLTALQQVGLCTVTTTPMNAGPALRKLLARPVNEKVHLLLPVGYAHGEATVPDLRRKALGRVLVEM